MLLEHEVQEHERVDGEPDRVRVGLHHLLLFPEGGALWRPPDSDSDPRQPDDSTGSASVRACEIFGHQNGHQIREVRHSARNGRARARAHSEVQCAQFDLSAWGRRGRRCTTVE